MKFLVLSFLYCTLLFQPDLTKIRAEYPKASQSEELAKELYKSLLPVTKGDSKVLVAYKGAASTIMALFGNGFKEKTDFFNKGRDLLEYAVKEDPSNIEIRCIRMSVQENSPNIVGYRDNIEEDKKFILINYKHTRSKEVKTFVRNYALQSDAFDDPEKQKL
ncbi:hypothetical protein K8352_05360 [Flavobacteriaceae bacterium F89]|uniref:Uncharacterized protein n=1 Tax=Cerina litoralis TaxID=2874477 RepID=A0AAE3EUV5_9FLAO|nr:hypothetical protein [Cerina litoralis]MCG2460166.1 hypothetical protein [Cerina litoralis]